MRMPRLRFTVRRLMIVVAVVAATSISACPAAGERYRWKVRFHAQMERSSIIAVIEGPNSVAREEWTDESRIGLPHQSCCPEA